MEDIYTIETSAFPSTARILTFKGVEAISRPFRFELHVNLPGDDAKSLDLLQAVGSKATLARNSARTDAFTFQGILTSVELVHAHMSFALFKAVLEPRWVRLQLTRHSRLFTDKSFPDVLKAVLEENALSGDDFSIQLTGNYATEEHITQYHESDFDFLSRWMEHLGIYYFFEHGDEKEKLVICDSKSAQTDLPTDPVRYFPALPGDRSAAPGVEAFRARACSLPASVRLKDYDHTKPTLDISGTAKVADNGVGEISVYGVRAFTPDDVKAFAKVRAEELLARQMVHTGSSTVLLRAGYQFTLEEHPIDAINAKYLVTEVEHFGNLSAQSPDLLKRIDIPYVDVYRCDITAVPEKAQFRPVRATPWPRIYGFEHGTIDGEVDSEYAQIDDHGRYKVKFAFDESDLKDGKGSTWVRMMQPHGGSIEGFHFPQRKNTEVVFAFLGGDPDRPVIAGVVNNTVTPSPVTSGNNTRNVIQTGGRNRIEIEDKSGQERVSISSPHANSYIRMGSPNDAAEMHINTDGSGIIHTKVNLNVNVDANLTEKIIGTTTQTYHAAQEINSDATRKDTVGGTLTTKVTGAVSTTYLAGETAEIHGSDTTVVGDTKLTSTGTYSKTSTGAYTRTSSAGETINVTGSVTRTVSGSVTDTVTGPFNGTVAGQIVTNSGAKFSVTSGATCTISASAAASLSLAASLSVTGGVNISAFAGLSVSATAGFKAEFGGAANLRAAAAITQASPAHTIDTGDLNVIAAVVDVTAAKMGWNGAFVTVG